MTIFAVRVLTPFKIESGILAWFPATMITAIVSPIALPMPRMTPASIPGFAAGTITLNTAPSCVAPSALAPS